VSDVVSLLTPLLERDPGGRSWLPALLQAAPRGVEALGELADDPGYLSISLSVRGVSGQMACFAQPVSPPREVLAWYVDHPDRLTWPPGAELTPEATVLRRALIHDQPPGARPRAQERARELMSERSVLSKEWWRFEERAELDCVLMTNRLVLVVEAAFDGGHGPVSNWYPARTQLVRDLEAARALASEGRRWAALLLGEGPSEAEGLEAAAPHLDEAGRRELRDAYLGALSWEAAAGAVAP
jgi:hypothetical protein